MRHIHVTIEALLSSGLASLEEVPILEPLGLLATTNTGNMCTFAPKMLSSCLNLPQLRVLELVSPDHELVEGSQQTAEISQVPQDAMSTSIRVWIPRFMGEPIAHRKIWNLICCRSH